MENELKNDDKETIRMVLETIGCCINCDSCRLLAAQCLVMIDEKMVDLDNALR